MSLMRIRVSPQSCRQWLLAGLCGTLLLAGCESTQRTTEKSAAQGDPNAVDASASTTGESDPNDLAETSQERQTDELRNRDTQAVIDYLEESQPPVQEPEPRTQRPGSRRRAVDQPRPSTRR
jgi:outer membrane murein-binding lipoprotein Lpp